MMRQKQSGGTNKVEIENLDELKPGEGVRVDSETKYEYGSDLQTEGVPLIDPGQGKQISIRVFQFKMNPETKDFSNKQAIFNSHTKQISTILWGDGLIPFEGAGPRVIINKKKRMYQIFVPCEARLNVVWGERAKNLSEELLKSKKMTRPSH